MIIEFAQLTIRAGSEPEFEAAFPAAIKVLGGSKGYIKHELRRSIETPNRYALIIQWQTLEDHTVGFRGSPAFAQWRALIGPYFDTPPVVEHFDKGNFTMIRRIKTGLSAATKAENSAQVRNTVEGILSDVAARGGADEIYAFG